MTIATAVRPAAPTPAQSRMSLSALVRGKQERPLRIVLYGVEGVGKSTFAADAPNPIFVGAEDGTATLDVARFPMPTTWQEVLDAVRVLTVEQHDFKTVVFDTLDWMEPLAWAFVCARDGQKDIEGYGYGKGYVAALDAWRVFLAAIERLRETKHMNVIFLAHSWIKPFKNPEGDDFDRYEMKLHAKASGLIREWCDVVLFANFETFAEEDRKTKRAKGISSGARLAFTTRTAAFDAKNRHDLPPSVPLQWNEFFAATQAHQPADPALLKAEAARKIAMLPESTHAKCGEYLASAGDDAVKLAKLNDWLNAKIGAAQ